MTQVTITTEQLHEVVSNSVKTTLEGLGIDVNNKINTQADFARLRALRAMIDDEEFQKDVAFMRKWRVNSEKVSDVGISTTIKVLATGLLGILALGTKEWWLKHITG